MIDRFRHIWLSYLITLTTVGKNTLSFQPLHAQFSRVLKSKLHVVESNSKRTTDADATEVGSVNKVVDKIPGLVNTLDSSEGLGSFAPVDTSKYLEKTSYMPGLGSSYPHGNPCRGVFCSRSLNMSDIKVIGYDMDYTLVRYRVNAFENCAYEYAKDVLRRYGFWVDGLSFYSEIACRGLIVDKDLGNIVKVDRFGYVQEAMHGTKKLTSSECTSIYGRELVDLRDTGRWVFINTLFSVSECSLYMQLVERLDDDSLQENSVPPFDFGKCDTYNKLFSVASKAIYRTHVEGDMKKEIQENPERFIELDLELVPTLVEQSLAGRKLALITNSNWEYTNRIMTYLVSEHFRRVNNDVSMPPTPHWRQLFDVVIVSARKPDFFMARSPVYRVLEQRTPGVGSSAVMQEDFKMREGEVFNGGWARMVEKLFNCSSDSILYVGDHVFADLNIAKTTHRWRTLLVVQELEKEVLELAHCRSIRERVADLVEIKRSCLQGINELHMAEAYHSSSHGKKSDVICRVKSLKAAKDIEATQTRTETIQELTATVKEIDGKIEEELTTYGASVNKFWGLMSRAGVYDKSHMMRQIEKYADIYTSRVSNLLHYTPYAYYHSSFQSLAHDKKNDLILYIESNNFEEGHG